MSIFNPKYAIKALNCSVNNNNNLAAVIIKQIFTNYA
ncbi:hypothetical protein N481_08330 [Pseudoalteromonas luteoviolacea S4047-1]|uniref:Uncharacterized protein n=1 Tax=Pseudoalteromonas luteoviolacea S4054 TaxID=1129367 RepID=A0A0F6ABP6_9GAMM|nr:hypothetical protein N479_16150 [Pseudoalteromonas luteoviolacea S4054]KZN75314.1 hypothetical protein N481_08330 [Pseudoalteromonas luteoviolacea S4047-1]